jgi:nucleotide-binding universal stress UspA family protein
MLDVIFVPVDGSEFSHRAVSVAERFADLAGAALHLFSVVTDEAEVMERSILLEKIAVGRERAERSVVTGSDPAGAIVNEVRKATGAAVCMATHGRGRSAALVGSVATRVVALGGDPILIGPRTDIDRALGGVVACVDETPESAALVPIALHWSELLRTHPVVIIVAEPVPPAVMIGPPRRRFGPDDDVDAYLDHLVAPWRWKGYEIETRALYDPISPADGVDAYLREHPALLAVVGSRARIGIKRVVFGSTSAQIVHRGAAPVLVVPRSCLHAS